MNSKFKQVYRRRVPVSAQYAVRALRRRDDFVHCFRFVMRASAPLSLLDRLALVGRLYWISIRVDCQHTQREVLAYVEYILCLPDTTSSVVVEAGCYKGGGTAKFSVAAKLANRRLVVFDSFEGLPPIAEDHGENIFGHEASFSGGDYTGSYLEVRSNVERYGCIDVCDFVQGWFSDTLPQFNEPIAGAYLDVDLVASTEDCLINLFPLLDNGATLFSQDGHLPLVLDVFTDGHFWAEKVGCSHPILGGVGTSKLITAIKQ